MIVDHWIRGNATSRLPNRFIFLDSEATETITGYTKIQTWRLAVTAFDHREKRGAPWQETHWQDHTTPESLWTYIDSCTKRKARTVLFAHNLAYDLRITQAFHHLGRLGWGIHRLSVHDRSVGAVLRRDNRSLVLVDSMAWLPMGLAKVGQLVGTQKLDLPCMDDPDSQWLARCRMDVNILRAAMLDLLTWVEDDDLGNWQRTGAGQAWATWRHRFYTNRVLVHSDEEAQAAEVASTYTGRCEAWRHGKLERGQWHEWDMALCYPRVAQSTRLPARFNGRRQRPSMRWLRRMHPSHRLLVRATVSTPSPVLPTRQDGHILWPTGDFEGWWWECELFAAEDAGATVTPIECFDYWSSPCLAKWADWVIDLVESPPPGFSLVRQAAAKHQARALIGRFGTRYTMWRPWGAAHPDAIALEGFVSIDDDESGQILTLGDEAWIGTDQRYGADACIAIMAAVMAEARCRLWAAMNVAGLQNVAYIDTDSLIVNEAGHARLAAWTQSGEGFGLREKDAITHLTILGPRQLVTNGNARISGVPANAQKMSATLWSGEKWEGLTTALSVGHADRVVIRPADWRIEGTDRRRLHLADGRTAAVAVGAVSSQAATG